VTDTPQVFGEARIRTEAVEKLQSRSPDPTAPRVDGRVEQVERLVQLPQSRVDHRAVKWRDRFGRLSRLELCQDRSCFIGPARGRQGPRVGAEHERRPFGHLNRPREERKRGVVAPVTREDATAEV
jgi:hypothetical protein